MTWEEWKAMTKTSEAFDANTEIVATIGSKRSDKRSLLKAFADELVKRLEVRQFPIGNYDDSAGAISWTDFRNGINELLTESGVER